MTEQPHPETQCVHSGGLRDATTGGINSPIYTSTAADYLDRDRVPYQRYFNTANQEAVVRKVCTLEGAEDGVLFSSGMAAISTTLLALLRTGDHAVLQDELYGGTHAFVAELFQRLGIAFDFVTLTPAAIERALTPSTKVIFLESPTNPLLHVIDLRQRGGRGSRTRRDNGDRQHVRDAHPPEPGGARYRCCRAQRHQVSRRPQRPSVRHRGHQHRLGRTDSPPRLPSRRQPQCRDLLSAGTQPQDAAPARGTSDRECRPARRVSRRASGRGPGLLSRPARRLPATPSPRRRCAASAPCSPSR